MNTKAREAARRRRQRVMMQRRIAGLALAAGLVAGTAYTTNYYHQKEVQVLNARIEFLDSQVTELLERNQNLSDVLDQSNRTLRLFVDDTDVRATEPPIYNIPLSEELQRFTYTRCAEYGIVDYYELILAIMWQESNFTSDLVSKTHDYGIMQVNTVNHSYCRKMLGTTDFLNDKQNIDAGTYLVSKVLLKYDDVHKALMAYNMGEKGAATNWEAGIYKSTYSNEVVTKWQAIMHDNYNAK